MEAKKETTLIKEDSSSIKEEKQDERENPIVLVINKDITRILGDNYYISESENLFGFLFEYSHDIGRGVIYGRLPNYVKKNSCVKAWQLPNTRITVEDILDLQPLPNLDKYKSIHFTGFSKKSSIMRNFTNSNNSTSVDKEIISTSVDKEI